mmetsp:Transcript_61/g.75  ORF Transcript_61/g.75 Transcript_61/m.75 type:complete len:478 (-) Transcript_61:107-1540(-)|eukprot:scaffold54740_cov63-Cyclotella_meneghiniana.AAC.1
MMKSRIRQSSTIRKKVNLFRNKQSSCDDTLNHHQVLGESNADDVKNGSYFHDGGILQVDDDALIAMVERHNNTLMGIGNNNTTAKNQAAPHNPLTMDNEQLIAMYENDLKKFGLHPSSSSLAAGTTTTLIQSNDNDCNNAAMVRPPRPESFYGVNVNTNNNNNAKPQSSILRRNNAKPPLPNRNNDSINTVQNKNKRRSGNQRNTNNKSSSSSSANTSNITNNNNNTKKLASAEHIVLQKMSKSFDSLSKSYDELLERHYLKDTLPPSNNNTCACYYYDWIGIILHWFGYNRCGDAAVDRNRPVDEITIDYNSDGRRNGVRSGMRSQGGKIKRDYDDDDDDDAYTNPSTTTNMNWKQQNGITGKIKNNNSKIIETGKQSQRRRMSGPPIANYLVSKERSNSNSNEQLTRETLYSISHQDSKNSKPKNNLCNSSRGGNHNNNVLVVPSHQAEQRNYDPIQLRRQGTDSLLDELRQSVV